ncbi:MAG: winged helix-turn-helix domain-containing protein, partial [Acidimicrobiia bacterium]|nr:winged helix-turn-helix domain-containing protein [Acidimicrobiia bacterium]
MEVRVLGPVEVDRDGAALVPGGLKQRTVLALLIAARGRAVSVDALIDGVYGERAAPGARRTLATYISNLRHVLGDVIGRSGDGYQLDLGDIEVDAFQFEDEYRSGTT